MTVRRTITATICVLAIVAFAVGVWQFLGAGRGADWLTAAGGLGVVGFASLQLERENRREAERMSGARAKARPIAHLARRTCHERVLEVAAQTVGEWYSGWYSGNPPDRPHTLDLVQEQLAQAVSIAADADAASLRAATKAFDEFISAANIINRRSQEVRKALEPLKIPPEDAARRAKLYAEEAPQALEAVAHLRAVCAALRDLAPPIGKDHPLPEKDVFRAPAPQTELPPGPEARPGA